MICPASFLAGFFIASNPDGLARVQTVGQTNKRPSNNFSPAKIPQSQKAENAAPGQTITKTDKKTGRPSSYTEEIGRKVCELLASGTPMTPAKMKENGLPDPTTIYRWTEDNEAFRMEYTRARQYQAHIYADQIIELADTAKDANLARIQVDTRKWYASKVIPKIYGERSNVEVNHTVRIAEEHAAALMELNRRKREEEAKLIDVTPSVISEE